MRYFKFVVIAAVATVGALAFDNEKASADRVGGPVSIFGSVASNHSVTYNIPFVADNFAVVTVTADPGGRLDVFIYDADGHVTAGVRNGNTTKATVAVYREGVFRVEVRNSGFSTSSFVLRTN
jgi:hypothetical protein